MSDKELVKYGRVFGNIEVGSGVLYSLSSDASRPSELTAPVTQYDEATEIFETQEAVYAPA